MKSKKLLIFFLGVFFLLQIPLSLAYPEVEYDHIQRLTKLSLGNDSCILKECDLFTLNWLVPKSDRIEEFSMSIFPETFAVPPNVSEIYNLTVFCMDGVVTELDLKSYTSTSPAEFSVRAQTAGYSIIGEAPYEVFWCAFRRNTNNINRLPTEIYVTIDSIIMASSPPTNNTNRELSVTGQIALSINDFTTVNLQIWDLSFIFFEIGAILFGFLAVVGFVPLVLRWVVKRVTE